MAFVQFPKFSFTKFMFDTKAADFTPYLKKIENCLESLYSKSEFSVSTAQSLITRQVEARMRDRSAMVMYSFVAHNQSASESWKLKFYPTEIPHIRMGITSDIEVTTDLVQGFLSSDLIDVIEFYGLPDTQKDIYNQATVFEVGNPSEIYLLKKIKLIKLLYEKYEGQAFSEKPEPFAIFAKDIKHSFLKAGYSDIVYLDCLNTDLERRFLKECDMLAIREMPTSAWKILEDHADITSNDWIDARY